MGDLARAIVDVVHSVCEAMLGLDIAETAPPGAADGPADVAGCVRYTGAWAGSVVLRCDAGFAHACAAILLQDDACSDAAVRDAFGELTNMVAGNLKAVLPAPSRLSLPTVVQTAPGRRERSATAPGVALEHVHFQLPAGHRLEVEVSRDAAQRPTDSPDRRSPADIPR